MENKKSRHSTVMTSSVIYYSTDARKSEIYLLNIVIETPAHAWPASTEIRRGSLLSCSDLYCKRNIHYVIYLSSPFSSYKRDFKRLCFPLITHRITQWLSRRRKSEGRIFIYICSQTLTTDLKRN